MYKTLLVTIWSFFIFFHASASDEFVISNFKKDISDLSARKNEKKDFNGDVCALIIVNTELKDLKFNANISITEVKSTKDGYWLYVSPTERRIQIKKTGFFPLDYNIPENIESSVVYTMNLAKKLTVGFLKLSTIPAGAEVIIDGIKKGNTPFKDTLLQGSYKYSLKMNKYESLTDSFIVSPGANTFIEKKLVPKFGTVQIKSNPEGAAIFIDDFQTGAKTPHKMELEGGKHTLILTKENFEKKEYDFTLNNGKDFDIELELVPTINKKKHSDNWAIKWNASYLLNCVAFGLEKRLFDLDNFSFQLEAGYNFWVFDNEGTGIMNLAIANKGRGFIIKPEIRFYIDDTDMEGWYLAPGYRYRRRNFLAYHQEDYYTHNVSIVNQSINMFLGYQESEILGDLGVDINFGIGYDKMNRTPDHVLGIGFVKNRLTLPLNGRVFYKF